MDTVADELIDQYVADELPPEERGRLEGLFLQSQEGREKLGFALALRKSKAERLSPKPRTKRFYTFYLPVAASLLFILVLGGLWRAFIYKSDLDKGIAALQSAFREQRPFDARISALNYAPVAQQRGQEKIDYVQRNLAEGLLSYSVSERPSAKSHHAVGQYYLADRQFDKAIDQLRAALSLDPQNAEIHSDLGAALMEKGKADLSEPERGKSSDEFAESLEQFNKALELDGSLLTALFNRALLYQQMGLMPAAEDDWRKYLDEDGSSKWADEARQRLRLLEEQRKRTSLSKEEIFREFIRASESKDDETAWRLVSNYHNRPGNVVVEQLLDAIVGQPAGGAEEESSSSLQLLQYVGRLEKQRAGDSFFYDLARFYESATPQKKALVAQARRLMKAGHEGWGRLQVSEDLDLFGRAEQLFEQAGDVGEAKVGEYWISFCHYRQHDQEQSRAILEPLASFCEASGYLWLRVRCLYLLSAIQYEINEHSKAVDFALRSAELAGRTDDSVGMLNATSSLIEYYRHLGNYRRSLTFVQRSLPLVNSISMDPVQGARHYGFVAVTCASVGWYAAAAAYQREALRFALETKSEAAISYNYAFLGMIDGKLKNFDEALREARLAFEIAQAHSHEPADVSLMAYSLLQMGNIYRESGDFEKAVDDYTRSIELYARYPDFQTHLYQAHKGKLLCYVAQGNDQLAKEEITTTLSLAERYRGQIHEEGNRNTFFDAEQTVYDAAIDFEYSRLDDPRQAFEYLEAARARSLQDLLEADKEVFAKVSDPEVIVRSVSRPLTLEEVQRRLPDQAQILQYAVLERRLLVWVISKNKTSVVATEISRRELTEKVSAYVEAISGPSEPDREEMLRRAKELFAILIGPAEPLLDRGKETCIIPDKALSYLPFTALMSPSGRYLMEDYLLVTSPSPSAFIICSERAAQKEGARDERLLSVGNPRFDRDAFPSLPDLPSASREAREIASYYDSSYPLIEDKAELGAVVGKMKGADVIHLALHSVLDEEVPLRSKLLFAKVSAERPDQQAESSLHAYEIYNLRQLTARLVVLSACQTGAGRYYGGEGMSSLARPFIADGVPLVVASLWPVDSDATSELMISFHGHRRRESLSTAEALRSAQLDMLRGPDERLRHPYYWASFTLIGGYARF